MLKDLVLKNRSYRRFFQDTPVSLETLKELVDLARLSASGGNQQSLKYILSCEPLKNTAIFHTLSWARLLEGWGGPKAGERPSAYIVILHDKEISPNYFCDHGIAAQTILLGAAEKGLGGCMVGAIKKEDLKKALNLADRFDILLVVALGKPREKVVIETVGADGSTKYWRDSQDTHHVPKRALKDIILG
ncbi:MAG TPA: nitroreductase family protein [Dehalococcoidales bacterium]|nr:nitroreductase family protein [Dehalococcoidales bacterium]